MAIIQSGASADQLTIDPTSKGARVVLYDTSGNDIYKVATGVYLAQINVKASGATSAGSAIWTMRNGATKTIRITRIFLTGWTDVTTAAATSMLYELERFNTATPSGGTAITIVKKRNGYATSTVADIRQHTGALTVTSVVFENPFVYFGGPRSDNIQFFFEYDFEASNRSQEQFELAANEGICIKNTNAAVASDQLYGSIEWEEI